MFFKNLMIYRLAQGWAMSPGTLEEQLARQPLQACTGLSVLSKGWVPVAEAALVESSGKHLMIALGVEQKIVPSSVVKEETEARAKALETQQGYKPGKKQLRELKDRVMVELLPRAFAKRRVTRAWINPIDGLVIVDSSAPSRAEELLEKLRETLGELPITPVMTEQSAQALNTRWLASGSSEAPFELGEDAELRAPDESGGAIRYVRHGLLGKEVRQHISEGKVVNQLGLSWRGRLGLVLTEPLAVKRLKFLEIDKSRAENDEVEAAHKSEQFQADFALMAGELTGLSKDLIAVLGGEKI